MVLNRWWLCIVIAIFIALVSFPLPYMRVSEKTILQQMFSPVPLHDQEAVNWNEPSALLNLALFFLLKFLFIVLSVCLPIPSGVFTPSLLLGASFGRLYGYILKLFFGDQIRITAYALIGAAAVTSSVTRTLSVAMIVFEINGELSYSFPILIGVIISYAISNSFSPSIFDALVDKKNLPYLPTVRTENFGFKAKEIMKVNYVYLRYDSKLADLNDLVNAESRIIPVTNVDGTLLFTVEIQYLRKYIISHYKSVRDTFAPQYREILDTYFEELRQISPTNLDDLDRQVEFKPINMSKLIAARGDYESPAHSNTDPNMFNHEGLEDNEESDELDKLEDQMKIDEFWSTPIKWDHNIIKIDKSPFIINPGTPIENILIFFTMLNARKVFVIQEGKLVGSITKNELLKIKGN